MRLTHLFVFRFCCHYELWPSEYCNASLVETAMLQVKSFKERLKRKTAVVYMKLVWGRLFYFSTCVYFFCAFYRNPQNNCNFSVYFGTHRKIMQLFCRFFYFSVGIFGTHRIITSFSVCTKQKYIEKFVTHRSIRVSCSA